MVDGMLEVKILVDYKVVVETLARIGIADKKKKILYPSCYLYEENGKVYLVHFKQLFLLTREGAYNAMCEDDLHRRNSIAFCLRNWGLIEVADEDIEPHTKFIFVLPHSQKDEWRISHKFNFKNISKDDK